MPSEDRCQQAIIRALLKEGWQVLVSQYLILFGRKNRRLYTDLALSHPAEPKPILVEVKCFHGPYPMPELYQVLGQYQLYRQCLDRRQIDFPLYLAIPDVAYQSLFTEPEVKAILKYARIKLLVVDLRQEEVLRWIR
jgi:hypothetical protein